MERTAELPREPSSRSPIRVAVRLIVSACAILALRWPLPIFWSSLRGEGSVDGPIVAFVATFVLGLAGLPGFLMALWRSFPAAAGGAPRSIRLALLATLVSSVASAGWIGLSVREIGATLDASTVVAQLLPVGVVAVAAVMLRIDVARITGH